MSQLELRRETAGGAAQSSQTLMSSELGANLRKTRNRLPHEEADVLIAAGPPFDPEEFGFHLHAPG